MTEIVPQTDSFTEEATHLGDVHSGYARLVAWTTDTASGDSNVCAAGNLHNGYFAGGIQQVGSSGRFAAAKGLASVGSSDVMAFVWRPFFAVRARAKLAFRWKRVSGAVTSADFRRAAVGVRLAGHGSYTNTAGAESVSGGNGYWLVARNVASQPGAKFYLLRVNAGVTTLLASSTAVDVSEWNLTAGMWISITVSNVAGNPQIRCRRAALGREAVDGETEVDVFAAGDYTDTSGSKITAAGRCGFALSRPILGSAPLADWFEVTDVNTDTVVLRDEWMRSNYLIGAATAVDANSVSGRNLQPTFAGSVGGSGATRLMRDSGNNRVKNDSTSATIPGAWAFRASHAATQRRSALVTFNMNAGQTALFWIDLRGNYLHAPTSATARGYRLEITGHDTFGTAIRVYAIQAGVSTLLATRANDLLNPFSATTWDFDVQNVGGATLFDGIPSLVVRKNGTIITTWTLAGVSGVSKLADGTILDTRSAAILQGWEQAWGWSLNASLANAVYVDAWTDAASIPTIDDDLPNADVSTEVDGLSGTLDIPLSWPVETVSGWQAVRHEYDSDHAQVVALASRERRTWRVSLKAATQAEVDALVAFYDDHGAEIPFTWELPSGESVTGVFLTEDLTHVLKDRGAQGGVYSFDFEVQERFE